MMRRTAFLAVFILALMSVALAAVSALDERQPARAQQPLPSITPLFADGRPAVVRPYGSSSGGNEASAFVAQPTLIQGSASSFSSQPAAATPAPGSGLSSQQGFATLSVVVTLPPGVVMPTTRPGGIPTLAPGIQISQEGAVQSDNALNNIFLTVIAPIITFALTLANGTIVTAWNFAGAQGGFVAQLGCCIGPAVFGIWYLIFRRGGFLSRRR
ncbi:MAG: hypothetical protein KME04_10255 [Pleurocapsa minor GSE-CHR-MK-17-07R]|jgi:hypothetical protein|nr:hypothetical protein [Pleurocapsa minor GSE-CHR-MK 17-07R]